MKDVLKMKDVLIYAFNTRKKLEITFYEIWPLRKCPHPFAM